MYSHAEVHLCTEKKESLYTVQPKMEKKHLKMKKNHKSSKSIFYFTKWTDFTSDNTSLCDSITNNVNVQ